MSKKKNAAGAGSLRQRPDGRWEARFTYTDELGVKRRRSVYGDTQKETRQKLTAALKTVDEGTFVVRQRYTFAQWFREWLQTYDTGWKPRTRDDYETKANRYIIPAFGEAYLTAITPMQVQRFINRLSKKLSPKSVKNIHGILHSCLKQAVVAGLIPVNPADNTNLPKAQKAQLTPIMDDDVSRFITACRDHRYGNLFLIDLFTGLRQSEILGLQWSDIDFEAGTIHVQRQLQKARGSAEYFFLTTKNGKDRFVPFPPSISAVLKQERCRQAKWRMAAGEAWENQDNLVFTTETGCHLSHSTIQNNFRKFRDSLGLTCRFHDLRHSCAILALQSGASVKAVSDMLGHYSSAFTMDVYADTSKTMQQDTQNRMEAVFKAASNG